MLPLHSVQTVSIGTPKEVLGGNQWTSKRSKTLEALTEVQSRGCVFLTAENRNVRIGGDFQCS